MSRKWGSVAEARETEGRVWVDGVDLSASVIERLEEVFGIHRLAVDDVFQESTQPKTEEFDNHTFVMLKTARLSRGEVSFKKEVLTESVGFFIGSNWIVTLATDEVREVEAVKRKLQSGGSRMETRGPDFLAYEVMDRVVDSYFSVLDTVDDDLQGIDERILGELDSEVLEDVNSVRRDLLAFRKVLWPTREAVYSLYRGGLEGIDEETEKYYRDIYDHTVQEVELLETYRDLASGSRDIYMNRVSQSTNEVMKVLTTVATIFIPLTFIAGIYGMNFADSPYNMPELGWRFGYPAVMFGMFLVAVLLLAYFRNRDWI